MRPLAPLCLLGLGLLGTAQGAQPAAAATVAQAPKALPRIVVTFANPVMATAPVGSSTGRYGVAGYVLGQSAHALARRIAREYSLKEVASWPIQALAVHCVVYEVSSGEDVTELLERLGKDARIGLAQPLQDFHTLSDPQAQATPAYNDPLYDLQTNLAALDIARAHRHAQGSGVRIGLIDTGVDIRHPDLAGRIAGTHSFVPTPATSPAACRHGTAMAGVIAAVANNRLGIVGIAPEARLEVFEACWQLRPDADDAVCNSFTLARALAAALDAHLPLINLSIGGPADPLLAALVRIGIERGVTFVGAAGESSEGFPGGVRGVIVAGSVSHSDRKAQLTAPAEQIFTLRPAGEYDMESGTSVAAAEVTGAVALLMSASRSHLSSQAISSLLTSSGTHPAGDDPAVPVLDINDALERLYDEQHGARVASGTSQRNP